MKNKQFTVSVQVIEAWTTTIEAATIEAAREQLNHLTVSQIREQGSLNAVETNYGEVVGENWKE